jgi:hypothetical protein
MEGWKDALVHQVCGWYSGAAAYFGWMREAKRENTRCGLRPMSDKAASQKTRSPEGSDENGPAAALLLSHVSIQICSFVATASPARTVRPRPDPGVWTFPSRFRQSDGRGRPFHIVARASPPAFVRPRPDRRPIFIATKDMVISETGD